MHLWKDLKSDNILVKLSGATIGSQMENYLKNSSVELYGYPIELEGYKHTVVRCLSQPLPNFGVDESLENISICLADYSEGEIPQSTLSHIYSLTHHSNSNR